MIGKRIDRLSYLTFTSFILNFLLLFKYVLNISGFFASFLIYKFKIYSKCDFCILIWHPTLTKCCHTYIHMYDNIHIYILIMYFLKPIGLRSKDCLLVCFFGLPLNTLYFIFPYLFVNSYVLSISHFLPVAFQLLSFLLPLGCKGLLEKDSLVRQCSFLSIRQFFFHILFQSKLSTYHFVAIVSKIVSTVFSFFSLSVGSFSEAPNIPLSGWNNLYFPLLAIIILLSSMSRLPLSSL